MDVRLSTLSVVFNHRYYLLEKTNKGQKQIAGISNAFIVKDDIEFGYQNILPLWTFGYNY
jgi:hypothetical protein